MTLKRSEAQKQFSNLLSFIDHSLARLNQVNKYTAVTRPKNVSNKSKFENNEEAGKINSTQALKNRRIKMLTWGLTAHFKSDYTMAITLSSNP